MATDDTPNPTRGATRRGDRREVDGERRVPARSGGDSAVGSVGDLAAAEQFPTDAPETDQRCQVANEVFVTRKKDQVTHDSSRQRGLVEIERPRQVVP